MHLFFLPVRAHSLQILLVKLKFKRQIESTKGAAHGSRAGLGIQISLPEMLVCGTLKDLQSLCVEWNFKITLNQGISKFVIGFCVCLFFFS